MKIFLVLMNLVFCGMLFSQKMIRFDTLRKELGDLTQGEVKEMVFEFQNVGKEKVLIKDVVPQCGCTAVSYDENGLLPKERSNIVLSFDSEGKLGLQRKTATVIFTNNESYVLVITANVLP